MTARLGIVAKAHRLLAPRIAFLIGSLSPDGEPNLIPVSNVTSVSTEPQLVLVAIHRDWRTHANLTAASGFTLSVPAAGHLPGVWRLGARYSGYEYPDRPAKLVASGLVLSHNASPFGPVLLDGLGWLVCRIVQRLDLGGDHGAFVGQVEQVAFDEATFDSDGTPRGSLRPAMQITGNRFTTAAETSIIPYGD